MAAETRQQGWTIGRLSAWVAWSLCVLSLTLTALSLVLLTMTLFRPDGPSKDLVGVVRETMQPAHVSLWLRPIPPPGESGGSE